MTNQIVTVNVSQTQAPLPNTLQKTGALISHGGTTLAVGTKSLLTTLADLTAILKPPAALTSLTWSASVVTAVTAAPHGYATGDVFPITIAGASPTGYNGTFTATVTGTTGFTYPRASDPGSETVPGTYVSGSVNSLQAMANTFFAQGSSVSVYVLELGATSVATGVANLTTFINNNPATIYSYLVPRFWDAAASFLTFLAGFESTTALTYFYVTTTNATYTSYSNLMKCVFAMIEAPTVVPSAEFSLSSVFWNTLHTDPSSTNKVAPLAFRFLFGVTPYPTSGSGTLFTAWRAAGVNWIEQGSEGGITNTILKWGTFLDGRVWNYWYSVDWLQININLNISNAVINGSNNPINPLYLNQDGINRLQAVGAQTLSSAVTFGLALGTVIQTELNSVAFTANLENGLYAGNAVINAIPFRDYYTASPSDFRIGKYAGFSITYTPLRGFENITININVTDFVA